MDFLPMTGTYRHNLDAKHRIFIPAKLRDALGTPIVVYPSIRDSSLKVCSAEEWRTYIEKLEVLPVKDREKVMRFFNQSGDTLTPDAQGRIVLNDELVDHAKLEGVAVIVGCGKNVEIWSEKKYSEMKENENIEDIRNVLESFGL